MYPAMGGTDYIQGESSPKQGTRGQLTMRPLRVEETDTSQPKGAIIVDNERETVGYQATCHGITASPRTHQMLKDQRVSVDLYTVR